METIKYLWIYHWHCILPALMIIGAFFLMNRKKDGSEAKGAK
jgi:hypothetical protein